MEKLFSLNYGVGGICVLLTLMILIRVGEFLWHLREQKEHLSEKTIESLIKTVKENTNATTLLDARLGQLEATFAEFQKMKTDLRRAFSAIKEIAGDEWPAIRDEILKDGFAL